LELAEEKLKTAWASGKQRDLGGLELHLHFEQMIAEKYGISERMFSGKSVRARNQNLQDLLGRN